MKKWLTTLLFSLLLVGATTTVSAATFKDVPPTYWAYPQIEELSKNNIIDGYNDGRFQPGQPVTRGQAAKIIGKALKLTPSANFKPKFKDVPPSHYAYNEIAALAEKGIIANSTNFNPNAPLTRAQMAKILVEGFNVIVDDNHRFNSSTYQRITGTAISLHLQKQKFRKASQRLALILKAIVTRAQLAAFTGRALEFDAKREVGTIYYDKKIKMYIDKSKPVPLPEVIHVPQNAVDTIDLANKERVSKGVQCPYS